AGKRTRLDDGVHHLVVKQSFAPAGQFLCFVSAGQIHARIVSIFNPAGSQPVATADIFTHLHRPHRGTPAIQGAPPAARPGSPENIGATAAAGDWRRSEAQVGGVGRGDVLEVVDHAVLATTERANALLAHVLELLVTNGKDHALVAAGFRFADR